MRIQSRTLLPAMALIAFASIHDHCRLATTAHAQTAQQHSISGTVNGFRVASLEIGIQPDDGNATYFKVGPDTETVQVQPGERDLSKAKPVRVTDISRGDRILVTFVAGLTEARRIVLISATDISARNEAERQDWKKRGVSGIVTSKTGNQVTIEVRGAEGAHSTIINVGAKTHVRRYAPDTVKFADAVAATLDDVAAGDQLQARGQKNADETSMAADDVVFGTFLTRMGTVTAIHADTAQVEIQEVTTGKPLTVRLVLGSQIKVMPDMRQMLLGKNPNPPSAEAEHGGGAQAQGFGRFDLQQALTRLPQGKIEDLKQGSGLVVTSTKGANAGEVTAIMVLANADLFVKMQSNAAGDANPFAKLHGGMLVGSGGLSLPTMIQ